MDYLCAKFGEFSFSRFDFTCEQTAIDTQNRIARLQKQSQKERITEADQRYRHTTIVGVSNDRHGL